MASTKDTHICSGIFSKLKVGVAFLKFVEIAMQSIQLTLQIISCKSDQVPSSSTEKAYWPFPQIGQFQGF
jgi:hypothetical protein